MQNLFYSKSNAQTKSSSWLSQNRTTFKQVLQAMYTQDHILQNYFFLFELDSIRCMFSNNLVVYSKTEISKTNASSPDLNFKKVVLLYWHLLTLTEKIVHTFHMNNRKYYLKLKWSWSDRILFTSFCKILLTIENNYINQSRKSLVIRQLWVARRWK